MSSIEKNKYDLIAQQSFAREPFYASRDAEQNVLANGQECISRPLVMKAFPTRVRFDLTNACNLRCDFCFRKHFESNDRSLLLPEDIDRLDKILYMAKYISLSQKSEAFASPHIVAILERLKRYNAVISVNTNGQLMNQQVCEALIRSHVQFVSLSVHLFDEQSYEACYKGGSFQRLVENINLLNRLKEQTQSLLPRLRISYVLRMDTLQGLDDAIEFVKKYEIQEGIQLLMFYRIVEDDKKYEINLKDKTIQNKIQAFLKKAASEGILVNASFDVDSDMVQDDGTSYNCFDPWESINVNPNGDVTPCSIASAIMGNIRETDIMDIWSGDEFKKFRRHMDAVPKNKDCCLCWHCRAVNPETMGNALVKKESIYQNFTRKIT